MGAIGAAATDIGYNELPLPEPTRLRTTAMRDTRRTMAGKKKARQSPTARRQAGSAKSPKKKPKAAKQAAKRKSQGAKKKNKAAKQAARKTTTSKKTTKKKAASQSARKTAKQKTSPKKRTNRLKSTGRKSRRGHAAPPQGSLGRPKVTGEEKLFLLFKQDYHARQVFSFKRGPGGKHVADPGAQKKVYGGGEDGTQTKKRKKGKVGQQLRQTLVGIAEVEG